MAGYTKGIAACVLSITLALSLAACGDIVREDRAGAEEAAGEGNREAYIVSEGPDGSSLDGNSPDGRNHDSESLSEAGRQSDFRTAWDYAQDMGIGINIGNTLDAYWEDLGNRTGGAQTIGNNTPYDYETCWGQPYITRDMIDGIRDAGFRTVRIPVYWGNMMADDGTYTIDEAWFERVEEVVDYCLEDGMYVVLNIHHYDEFLIRTHSREEVPEIIANLWRQIAERFADYSDYLIFEGFNESLGTVQDGISVTEEERYDYVNDMNQAFVDSVRGSGGNNRERVLIISGYWTNIDKTVDERFVLPRDSARDRLMVSVHYVDNICYWNHRVGGEYWLAYCEEQCKLLRERFTDANIPVFVGECTAVYDSSCLDENAIYRESSAILEALLTKIADYDMIPVLWDESSFYDRDTTQIRTAEDARVIENIAEKMD